MKWLTFKAQKSPGFRFNITDFIFILFLCNLSFFLYLKTPGLSLYLIPLYLGGTFFLFCNVFQIGNRLEAFWYIPFTLVAAFTLFQMNLTIFWLFVIYFLEPLKWGLIILSIKRTDYKGIFYSFLKRNN